jgi:hypothetical protein
MRLEQPHEVEGTSGFDIPESATIASAARKMLAREAVADVAGKVLAFGIGGEEVTIVLRREIKVAIEFARCLSAGKVCAW